MHLTPSLSRPRAVPVVLFLFLALLLLTLPNSRGHIHKRKGAKAAAGGTIPPHLTYAQQQQQERQKNQELGIKTAEEESVNGQDQSGQAAITSERDREFLWFSNKAGIFSQFVQLKIMHFLMEKSKRTLTIAPSYSPHYGDLPIILCDIFVLPSYIRCPQVVSLGEDVQCITHTISLDQIASDKNKLCYQGPLPRLGAKTPREAIIRGVDIPLPLRFQSNYTRLTDTFRRAIGLSDPDMKFTVVHWRRGDQLSTRCQQRKDMSINCGSAEELVGKVRDRTNDTFVYIATNEIAGSSELVVLQEAGFKLFTDAKMDVGVIETFLIEVSLMRDAHTFLGWGVSEVNDVVEFERRNAGKSWCATAQDDLTGADNNDASLQPSEGEDTAGTRIEKKGDPTWCAAQLQLQLANGSVAHAQGKKAVQKIEVSQNKQMSEVKADAVGLPVVSHAFESNYNFTAELKAIFASGANYLHKRIKSKGKRLVFVAGLEGSGHDLMARVMHSCSESAHAAAASNNNKDIFLAPVCEKDVVLSSLLLDSKGREISGLFASDDAVTVIRLVNSVEGRLRRMNASFAAESIAKNHLVFVGLGASSSNRGSASMLTYPVGPVGLGAGSCDKSLAHPDIFLLALLCERAGIDLRVVVLQRAVSEILGSVTTQISSALSAGAGANEKSFSHGAGLASLMLWQRSLVDNAALLASQLELLDPAFIHCVQHRDLQTMLNSSTGRWGANKAKYEQLVDFVHPAILPDAFKLARLVGNASLSSEFKEGDSGATYQWNYYQQNAGYSAAFQEFQLATRLRQIDSLCSRRHRESELKR